MEVIPPQPTTAGPIGQPPQKSNTTKIIVIVVAVVAVFCLIACVVVFFLLRATGQKIQQSVESDPQAVAQAGEKIAAYTVPPGFQPQGTFSLLGMTMVAYSGPAADSSLALIQMPTSTDMTEANIRQMEDQMQRQFGRRMQNLKTIAENDETIRGKPGKVIIQEGESDGTAYRQMLAVFQGKGGLAMLMIIGPASSWDQEAYNQMVQSIQ